MSQVRNSNAVHPYKTGDEIKDNEASLIVSNHPSEADWLFWPAIAIRKSLLPTMRFTTKDVNN
jgi:1-acyl-sn-glycerol-3-phosphate acyltransferase